MDVHETIPWKLRSRKSTENRWDYNIPVSRISQQSLSEASATFEPNYKVYNDNIKQIEVNKVRMKAIDELIISSEDTEEIYALAQEKNNLAMGNGNLEASALVAKKNYQQALKVIHEHRGDIGDFYLDGPHTTEFKALFGWPTVVLLGAGAYYIVTRRNQLRRGVDSAFRRSPIGGAFRYA